MRQQIEIRKNIQVLEKFPTTRVGVVVLNYRTYAQTISYVKNYLLSQTEVQLEVVVVDNSSPNDSYFHLKRAFNDIRQVTVLKSEYNGGYAYGNNIGVKFLEKKDVSYILISNSDVILKKDNIIRKMTLIFDKISNVGFISPVMLVNNKISYENTAWKSPTRLFEILTSSYILKQLGYLYVKKFFYQLKEIPKENEVIKVDCLPGSFFMGKAEVFSRINYLDEKTFLYYEETILAKKIKAENLQNYLIRDIEYHHIQEQSINEEFNYFKKHLIHLKSRLHYWNFYHSQNKLFNFLLMKLLIVRTVEFRILRFFKLR